MQLRSKSVVFAIAAALGAGLTVPGALALAGSSSDTSTSTKPAQVQPAEQTHEADAAEQHEATEADKAATDDDQSKTDDSASDPTTNPKAFGVTGNAHRSDTAAEHSQADCHRATGPGQPADGSKCTPPQATTPTNDATEAKGDDDATEVENEDEATETEHDDESGEVDNSGAGSTESGHGSSHSGSDGYPPRRTLRPSRKSRRGGPPRGPASSRRSVGLLLAAPAVAALEALDPAA